MDLGTISLKRSYVATTADTYGFFLRRDVLRQYRALLRKYRYKGLRITQKISKRKQVPEIAKFLEEITNGDIGKEYKMCSDLVTVCNPVLPSSSIFAGGETIELRIDVARRIIYDWECKIFEYRRKGYNLEIEQNGNL